MRLACPNCDARYEVAEDAVPPEGRDVQCSNCGHGWFQMPVAAQAADLAPLMAAEPAPLGATRTPAAPAISPDEAVLARIGQELAQAKSAAPEAGAGAEDEAPAPMAAPRAALDPSIIKVLQEEAEREAEARKLEAQKAAQRRAEAEEQLQVQTEMGLDPVSPRRPKGLVAARAEEKPTQTQAELAVEARAAQPPEPVPQTAPQTAAVASPEADGAPLAQAAITPSAPAAPQRRDLLPDVEEINSSLRPDLRIAAEPAGDFDAQEPVKSHAFRTGFLISMGFFVLAALSYGFAADIARLQPDLAEPMGRYVAFVDALRLSINGAIDQITRQITPSAP